MIFSQILGTGSAFPEGRLDSAALGQSLGKSEDWILQRTGIQERRISSPKSDESTSSLAAAAARRALDAAGISVDDLDLIICCTATPDRGIPNTASYVHQRLAPQKHIPCFDINAACAGFIYGLSVVDALIRCGSHKCILLIGCEVLSPLVDWSDPGTCIIFGDGAGAMVISKADAGSESKFLSHHLHTDASQTALITVNDGRHIAMKGREVFRLAVTYITDSVVEALQANGLSAKDLSWFVPHQANLRIVETVAKNLEFPMERVVINIGEFGNTSAASIPTAFDGAVRSGQIKRGQLVCCAGLGAGLTYGATLLRY